MSIRVIKICCDGVYWKTRSSRVPCVNKDSIIYYSLYCEYILLFGEFWESVSNIQEKKFHMHSFSLQIYTQQYNSN